MPGVRLKIGDNEKLSTKITYEDLIVLYKQFIYRYGEVPVYSKCDLRHNMPQGRIVNRILKENNITYNDFLLQFGKVSHVRTESMDYDIYVQRYKEISDKIGRALKETELINNKYGLPSSGWFVKYCPCDSVKTFVDFVRWCGYDVHYSLTKEFVSQKLIELENRLGRPILREDITENNIGFSTIVLNRLYGGLNDAKKEIGLMRTLPNQPLSFEYYKITLTEAFYNLKNKTGRNFASWHDLESGLYHKNNISHKSMKRAFDREGLDIFSYIKSIGFEMNPNSFGHRYVFNDGERTISSMEFDFSTYLRSIGYVYNSNYFRDVMYKKFTGETGKINCDYVIDLDNNKKLYIEIAGVIYNDKNDNWRTCYYSSKKHREYQKNLIRKENLLIESNCNYLFLFPCDMVSGDFKNILINKINYIKTRVA